MYGTQASIVSVTFSHMFENDVKMYGTQAEPGNMIFLLHV